MFLTLIAYARSKFMINPFVFIFKRTDAKALNKEQFNAVTVTL